MQAVQSVSKLNKKISPLVSLLVIVMLLLLMIVAISVPNLLRSRIAADQAARYGAMKSQETAANAPDLVSGITARQVVRTAEMSLLVDDAAGRVQQIHALAERYGGFVESSQVWHGAPGGSAQMTLRIPAARLDEVRSAIRDLSKKVEAEKTGDTDATAQAVDLDASLRNYRAEEQQYLAILQRASNVKDTLDVAQRLSEVRGRIERTDAQVKLLSRQVAMATLTLSLRTEAFAQVRWLPDVRQSWQDAAESMASYIAAMTALIMYAPAVLAWFFTIVVLLAVTWRTLRWIWTRWFAVPQAARV